LRCLDVCNRLRAARCNKQLLTAASHPFAWPPEQMATLEVDNDAVALQALGARVRGSLLRLAPIRLEVLLPLDVLSPLSPEVFVVPNMHTIRLCPEGDCQDVLEDCLLPMLRHPSARQLRSLDVSYFVHHCCSVAELQQLQTLPHLHSLSLGWTACCRILTLQQQQLSLLPALTHLGLNVGCVWPGHLYVSLSLCTRLVSVHFEEAIICAKLINCLAQLPSLQRLHFERSAVKEQTAGAWAVLRSLRELRVDRVREANRLLSVPSTIPSLRLLRWRCHVCELPPLESLRPLLLATSLLQVELVMQRTFEKWQGAWSRVPVSDELTRHQRLCWVTLQQLPVQLRRVHIVELEPWKSLDDE
jgi:hypothetical protein